MDTGQICILVFVQILALLEAIRVTDTFSQFSPDKRFNRPLFVVVWAVCAFFAFYGFVLLLVITK